MVGLCGVRQSRDGAIVTAASYGQVTSLAIDPIEKKPLARFHPGSTILSLGSYGCNLSCPFCQNSSIARMHVGATGLVIDMPPDDESLSVIEMSPESLAVIARLDVSFGSIGVAYTYNEPLVGYEYVRDCAQLIHAEGLLNVVVTNGYINEAPWLGLLPHLDAANIDLKGFTQGFYDRVGAPRGLETVKRSIALAAATIHVEVTTLIIPGLNDSPDEIDALACWLASVDPNIPLHLSRFFPAYRMSTAAPTPKQTIRDLVSVARQHLRHVYAGNM
jgi:pyruvate formate lyase activating enzyme